MGLRQLWRGNRGQEQVDRSGDAACTSSRWQAVVLILLRLGKNHSLSRLAERGIHSYSLRWKCGRRGVRNRQSAVLIGRPCVRLCLAVFDISTRVTGDRTDGPSYSIGGIHQFCPSTCARSAPMLNKCVACSAQEPSKPFEPKIETWWRRGL